MKRSIVFFSFCTVVFLCSCGPAAEDREAMYKRAKVFQDSIANVIKTSMDRAATPVPGGQAVPVNPTAQPTPSGQATQGTTK
jgi:hypothetical protein